MSNPKIYKTLAAVKKAFPNGIDKLEIGSGDNPEPGFVHADILPGLPDLDIQANVRSLPIPDNFVGEIRAVHIFEHFCHPEYAGKELIDHYGSTVEVLKECFRVLKPGGKLFIVTPDYEKIAHSAAKRRIPFYWLQRWSVGGHLNEYDVHHWLWTKADAQAWFREVGFGELQDENPIQGKKEWFLDWNTSDVSGNMKWHEIEWYHWLFFSGKKPQN